MWTHYLGLCRLVDDNVGRLCDALKRLGLAESTCVVFMSDHGEMLSAHGLVHKGPCFYEEQMRVPLVMAGPGIPAGRSVKAPVSMIDVFPTIAALAGVEPPDGRTGRSLLPLMEAHPEWPRDAVFAEYHAKQSQPHPMRAVFTSRWKYHFHLGDRDELFDLESDPGERVNRIDDPACRDARARLRARLAEWMREVRDPLAARFDAESD